MSATKAGSDLSAAAAAAWVMLDGAEVNCPWILVHAAAIHVGAPMYPKRQPVVANPWEIPLTVTVRSHMPGCAAMEACLSVKLMSS